MTPKTEVSCSPETPVDFQRSSQHWIQEDITLHNHHYENLKSYKSEYASKGGILYEAMFIIHIYGCETPTLGYRNESNFVAFFVQPYGILGSVKRECTHFVHFVEAACW
jgi:hypothetical protein